jgi:PAS domain S-box-containing protein
MLMLDSLAPLFDTSGFMPHGHCFLWTPSLLWSYVISDSVIAASYYSIPVALWYFAKKRQDLPYRWVFAMFGVFVMACGTTHLLAIWNIWVPNYWIDAGAKMFTAAASILTAIVLWPLIPQALAIPSQQQLRSVNQDLQSEVRRRKQAEDELRGVNHVLMKRVAERTAELEMANGILRASEARYRSLFENMLNGFAYCKMQYDNDDRPVDFVYLEVNDAFERLTGFKNVVGKPVTEVIPGIREASPELFEIYGRVASTGIPETFEFDFKSQSQWLFISVYCPEKGHFVVVFDDITKRKRADLVLARQKDLYDMLSQTNQTIVRVGTRDELFNAVCRIAVEHGHYLFAAIRLIDADHHMVPVVAHYGEDAGYLEHAVVSMRTTDAAGRGPAGMALRAGVHVINNDFLNDPATAPWHEAARRTGVGSVGVFPLRLQGAVTGALVLYAREPGFFTGDLLPTLDEMATDVSFALDNFEHEAERMQSGEKLRASEQRYRGIYQNLQDVYVEAGLDGTIHEISPQIEVLSRGQYTRDDVLGKSIDMFNPDPTRRDAFFKTLREAGSVKDFEATLTNRDGSPVACSISAMIQPGANGKPGMVCATVRDITLRKQAEETLRAAEEQFRGLVEQSIAGTYVIQDDKLAYVNPRFAEIFGYASADELIGRESLSLVIEKERSVVMDARRQIERGAPSMSYSFTALRKNGSMIEVGVHSIRATHQGRPAIIGLLQDISEKQRTEEQIKRYVAQLEVAFMQTVEVATTLSEMRDPYTAGHERRVAEIAVAIGAELGFDKRRQEGLRVAGYLHDIGKIMIPSEILSKPGKLSSAEFMLIKGHPQASYDVLKGVEFPWPVAEVALQHHERIDGSGYPRGLKGDAILQEARIMAVADVVEAMSSHRPYRPGLGIEMALAEIERGRATAYDPEIADVCLKLFRDKGYAIPA